MHTIVLIDDEFGLTDVLAATLSDAGHRVYTAANGVQGLELIVEHVPDLVFLDYMMPLLDGPGVLKAMRADPRVAQIPVVMMSAMPEAVVRRRTTDYLSFLRKPFDFEELLEAVRRALGEAKGASERGPGA
jgi:DNA-binding response OmpR family regulator